MQQNELIHFHPTGTFPQALCKLPLGMFKSVALLREQPFTAGKSPQWSWGGGEGGDDFRNHPEGCLISRKPCCSQEFFPEFISKQG